jgi:hypothetical protein
MGRPLEGNVEKPPTLGYGLNDRGPIIEKEVRKLQLLPVSVM